MHASAFNAAAYIRNACKCKRILLELRGTMSKPTPAVVEAWASLVRTESALLDKVEEALKRARLPPLDWYHVLHEIDRAPKGMLRQTGVQDRTQLAQYNVCRLVDRLRARGPGRAPPVPARRPQQRARHHRQGPGAAPAMWPVYAAAIEEHFGARLSQAEAEQLARLLAKVVQAEPG